MKNIAKALTIGLALLSLYGCAKDPRKEVSQNISVQDTLNAPITQISRKKKNIKQFYSQEKTVVFYTFQGCKGCEEIYPFYKKMAKQYSSNFDFGIVDAILTGTPEKDSVYVFPTIGIYSKGKLIKKIIGSKKIASDLEVTLSTN